MNKTPNSTTSKPPAKRAGARILPSQVLLRHGAEQIAKLAGLPVHEYEPFCDSVCESVQEVWKRDRRAESSEPGDALKKAARAARTLNEAFGSLNKEDRKWVEKLLNQEPPWFQERLLGREPILHSLVPPFQDRFRELSATLWLLACLFSNAAGKSAPLMAGTTRLPYKVGKRKGTVKDKTLHDLVFGLFSYAAGAGGALSLDKNRNFNKEGGALAEALNILRPYLPKGVIPDKLPLGTLQRILTQQSKARRFLRERP